MKNFNLFTKIITPILFVGIVFSYGGFLYLNTVIEKIINNEIEQKAQYRIHYTYEHLESEFKLLFYLYGTSSTDYEVQEKIIQKEILMQLKKYAYKTSNVVHIITPTESLQLSKKGVSSEILKELLENNQDKITIDEITYKIEKVNFKPWDWEVVYLLNTKNFEDILYNNKMSLLGIVYLLLLILIILISIIFKIYIKNPIDILLEHFKSITKGKYSLIKNKYYTTEIDLLIDDVNFMTKSIQQREEESKKLLKLTNQNQEYMEDILSSQSSIIIINDTKEILDVNLSFMKFFHEFTSLADFKSEHECVCDYFVKEEGFIYKYADKNWVEYVVENPNKLHKVKIHKDNQHYIYTVQAKQFAQYGRVIITMTDITALEKSNVLLEQYKKAVDAGAIVSKADINGRITYVNDKFITISGYTQDELIGKNHNIIRSKNTSQTLFEDMWKTIQNKNIWNGHIENRKKDGTSYFVSATIVPILDTNDNIYEYVALRYDITEQVLDKQKAQKAENSKANFLANMSHEIRTPLNAIIGFTKLLLNFDLKQKESKYIGIIDQSAQNLLGIINDILDLSKIENGSLVYEKIEFNPFVEFEGVINLFMINANEKSISLVSTIDPMIPQKLIGDPLRIKQVLSNLIANAIKFTPKEGTIFSKIELISHIDNSCVIKIEIQDSGIGIPKEKQKLIFEEFSQADDSTSREYGGTGLGLSISSQIVRALGSRIEVESTEGKGSKFFFEVEFETKDLEEINSSITPSLKKQNKYIGDVLIAEDHEINQQLISALLDNRGVKYKFADNGNKAVELFKKEKFDLILMDINMPEKNGLDATIEIIEIEKEQGLIHTPITALTANVIEADKQKIMDIGADDYLYKPIDDKRLDEVLEKYLNYDSIEENVQFNKYSLDKASQEMGLDLVIVKSIVTSFCNNIDNDLLSLQNAITETNYDEVKNCAHKIKGAALNLRMSNVAKFSSNIERDAIEKESTLFEKNLKLLEQSIKVVQESNI